MTFTETETNYNKYLDTKIRITEIAGSIKHPTFQYLKLLLVEKGFNINEKTFAENFHLLTKDGVYNKMSDLLADRNELSKNFLSVSTLWNRPAMVFRSLRSTMVKMRLSFWISF